VNSRQSYQEYVVDDFEHESQSQFDQKNLYANEKPFSPLKEDINVSNGIPYYSPEKKKQRFRLYQDTKAQHCKRILSQVQNLKIPKEILHNKDRFYKEEYDRFQEEVQFKEFKEFEEMLNNETIVTIEYYYEDRSKFHRELNETKEKFTTTALELADIIQRRFPFIDVIIKNLKQCDEIQEFHPYGLFEVQIVANQRAKTGILYSKKISYILPSPNKIIEEIYFFVDKIDIEIELYDLLKQTQVITTNGFANKKFYAKHLEGIEVILRQKVFDYQVNKDGDFLLYGLNKPTNKNEILSHTLGSSKTILYTRSQELDNSNINISGELSAHSKQNPVKTFMTKGFTNNQGIVLFKDIVVGVDNYEIEVNPVSFFHKEKAAISLLQHSTENNLKITIGLKPKNIGQVNINLYDDLLPLSGAIIKIFAPDNMANNEDHMNPTFEGNNAWLSVVRESENLPGNYTLLSEPGTYHIQIMAKGYTTATYKINIQKGENLFEFQMRKKILTNVGFAVVDMFTLTPLPDVEIMIYDHTSQLLASGNTEDQGQFGAKVELMTKLKIYTNKSNYVESYQEYMANTSAITEIIIIKMIPKDKTSSDNFEVIAAFPDDKFNVALQVICPDHTVVNEKNTSSQNFNIKYDELIAGKNSVNIVTYKPEQYSKKNNLGWEFEIVVTLKNLLNTNLSKLSRSASNANDISLLHDQSMSQPGSSVKKFNPRLSAANLFLNNRVNQISMTSIPSYRSSIKPTDSQHNDSATKFIKGQEDVKNLVDLNNCLRVYIIHKNVLQEVLYCCLKNLGNRIWRIGTFQVSEETFIKVNNPDMKDVQGLSIEESRNKLENKLEVQRSVTKLQPGNLRQKDMTTGFGQKRNLSTQKRR